MLEIDWNTSTILAEVFYCIIGLIFAFTGVSALKNKEVEKRTTTAIFWFILAITSLLDLIFLHGLQGHVLLF